MCLKGSKWDIIKEMKINILQFYNFQVTQSTIKLKQKIFWSLNVYINVIIYHHAHDEFSEGLLMA